MPLIDGKRREVFAAVYARDEEHGVRVVEEVRVLPLDERARRGWRGSTGRWSGGDGVALLRRRPARRASPTPACRRPPRPWSAGPSRSCVPGLVIGPDAVLPLYGRAPDAARWTGPPVSGGAAPAVTPAPDSLSSAAVAGASASPEPAVPALPVSAPEVRR